MIELQGLVRCMIKGAKGVDVGVHPRHFVARSSQGQESTSFRCLVLIFAVFETTRDIAPYEALTSFYELQILKTSALGKFSIKNSQLRQV